MGEKTLLQVLLSKYEDTKGYLGPSIAQIPKPRPGAQTCKYLEGCSNEKDCSTLGPDRKQASGVLYLGGLHAYPVQWSIDKEGELSL